MSEKGQKPWRGKYRRKWLCMGLAKKAMETRASTKAAQAADHLLVKFRGPAANYGGVPERCLQHFLAWKVIDTCWAATPPLIRVRLNKLSATKHAWTR